MFAAQICQLTQEITGKKPVQGSLFFRQDQEHIYYSHYADLIHELAHWLVSSQKEHPNLGFEEECDYSEDYPMFLDEMKARYLTYRLLSILDSPVTNLQGYADYMLAMSRNSKYSTYFLAAAVEQDLSQYPINIYHQFQTLITEADEVNC